MMFTEEEVATNPVRIIGKVVELRGKLKNMRIIRIFLLTFIRIVRII